MVLLVRTGARSHYYLLYARRMLLVLIRVALLYVVLFSLFFPQPHLLYFALLLQLPPFRNSNLGSHGGHPPCPPP